MGADAVTIRSAVFSDASSLAVLVEHLGYQATDDEVEARLERLLQSPHTGVLLAELGSAVVGAASFQVFELIYRPRPECRLTALVVHEQHRREGIGTALIDAVEAVAHERGCFRIELNTRPGRPDAVPFYAALGFSERPVRLVKWLDGE